MGGAPSQASKPQFANRPLAPAPKREGSAEGSWEKGARVGILTGPFAGKVGTIAEVEGSKSARVLLGLLSTRLDLSNQTLLDPNAAKANAGSDADLPKAP